MQKKRGTDKPQVISAPTAADTQSESRFMHGNFTHLTEHARDFFSSPVKTLTPIVVIPLSRPFSDLPYVLGSFSNASHASIILPIRSADKPLPSDQGSRCPSFSPLIAIKVTCFRRLTLMPQHTTILHHGPSCVTHHRCMSSPCFPEPQHGSRDDDCHRDC